MPTLQIIDVTMKSSVGEKNKSTDYKLGNEGSLMGVILADDNLCLHFIDAKMTTYQLTELI